MLERNSILTTAYLSTALIGGIVIATAPLLAPAGSLSGLAGIVAFAGSTAAAVAWGLAFAIKAHRTLDEYQLERARRAVYWGATSGVVASAPLYAFVAIGGLHRISATAPTGKPLAIAFASGYGLALVSIVIGITVSAAVLRRARLSPAA
jgi:hypothetical protein